MLVQAGDHFLFCFYPPITGWNQTMIWINVFKDKSKYDTCKTDIQQLGII